MTSGVRPQRFRVKGICMHECQVSRYSPCRLNSRMWFIDPNRRPGYVRALVMRPAIQEINSSHNPETLIDRLGEHCGAVLLRSAPSDDAQARYSFVAARPFLVFRSWGSRCEISQPQNVPASIETATQFLPGVQYGNPWQLLDSLMARYELLEELDLPFPLGGCFGFWGYDLKNFVEPKLPRRAINDLELPDCHVGFYDSLVVFDHRLGKKWIVSTGITADGS